MGEEIEAVTAALGITGPVNLSKIVAAVSSMSDDIEAVEKPETRIARQESWLEPRLPTEEERQLFANLPDIIGTGVLPSEPRLLEQEEIDRIALELKDIREAQDVLKGRHAAIKQSVFDAFDFIHREAEDPSVEAGEYISPELGYKISRTISGGKPFLNRKKIDAEFPDDLKHRFMIKVEETTITKRTVPRQPPELSSESVVRWELDENLFVKLVEDGTIPLPLLQKVIDRTPVTASFTPGPLPKNARP